MVGEVLVQKRVQGIFRCTIRQCISVMFESKALLVSAQPIPKVKSIGQERRDVDA